MADLSSPETKSQRRVFGFWICLALVIGNMVGSGAFLLPQALAPFGWNAIFGWMVTITGALCLAYVFAMLARRFPRAGGPYAFSREAFGPATGFAVAWSYWISVWTANAAISLGATSYLIDLVPGLANAPAWLAVGFVWTFTLVNCISVRGVGGIQLVTTILKILPLAAAIVLTLLITSGATPAATEVPALRAQDIGLGAIGASVTLTLWAMVGFESATIPAGHVKDPQRTIPRATVIGTLVAGFIYLFACSGVALLLPAEQAASSGAPFADFIGLYWGQGPASLVGIFAMISALGALNGWVLIQGEMPTALARDGVFPAWFAKTTKEGAPVRAHLVSSALITVLLLSFQGRPVDDLFALTALISTLSSLVAYLTCSLAALRLQGERRMERSGLLVVAALIGTLYSLWAIYGAGAEPTLWGAALLLSGFPIYLLMRRNRMQGTAVTPAPATEE